MTLSLVKNSIELGIVTKNPEPMLKFYRDTLGLELALELPMPGGGTMYRLNCGDCIIKLVVHGQAPEAEAVPGGINGATGYRYWTVNVDNIEQAVKTCEDAGYKIAMPLTEFMPGVTITMIEDPDGNWVELVQMANQ